MVSATTTHLCLCSTEAVTGSMFVRATVSHSDYVWPLKFEFHVIFRSQPSFLLFFPIPGVVVCPLSVL